MRKIKCSMCGGYGYMQLDRFVEQQTLTRVLMDCTLCNGSGKLNFKIEDLREKCRKL